MAVTSSIVEMDRGVLILRCRIISAQHGLLHFICTERGKRRDATCFFFKIHIPTTTRERDCLQRLIL